jgi:hypothetical protein
VTDLLSREFVECAPCAEKRGSPRLCDSCIANRGLISDLRSAFNRLESDYLKARSEAESWRARWQLAVDIAAEIVLKVRRRSRGEDS